MVINDTALYCVTNYSGELKWDYESKEMRFFDLDDLPENQNDPDIIIYIKIGLLRKSDRKKDLYKNYKFFYVVI